MPKADLNYIRFDDFSAGVIDNSRYQGGSHLIDAVGAAQKDGTYRCMATPTGALVPAPRRELDITLPTPADWGSNRRYSITGFDTRLGFINAWSGGSPSTNGADRVEMHLHLEYQNGADYKSIWYRYRIYDSASPTLEAIHTTTIVGVTGENRHVQFEHCRMNPATPTDLGQVVTVASWAGDPGTAAQRWAKAFPDPAAGGVTGTINVGDPTNHGYTKLFVHQGRVVFNRWLQYSRGLDTTMSSTDNWYWTDVNDNTLSTSAATPFVAELPQGITDAFSMTANELLAIKSIGGGFVVRGSLDNPTIIQLPNLSSPTQGERFSIFKGTNTAIGVVFNGLHGAYVWDGGDGDELISGQLEPDAFATDLVCLEHDGAAARWGDLIAFPNNWIYNTATQSWWRLDDPADLLVTWFSESRYQTHLYGAYHEIDNTGGAGDRQVVWRWAYDSSAYSYSWKSQPIPNPDGRTIKAREVILTLQGATQDVTVTVENEAGTTATATWTIAGGNAVNSPDGFTRLRKPITIDGRELTVQIEVDGSANTNAGALIRSLQLGVDERALVPNG